VAEPKPVEPISAAMTAFDKAIADQSCDEIERVTFSQTRVVTAPGAPAQPVECRRVKTVIAMTKGWRFDRSATYGTAALLEGPLPKKVPKGTPPGGVIAAIFVLDRDRKYRSVVFTTSDRQIGTKPSPAADDGGKNARAVVAAVRAKDCRKLTPLIHPQGSITRGQSVAATCKGLVNGRIFAPSVRATKGVEPKLLGATRDLDFYGVSTKRTYFTLIMATPPGTSDKPPLLYDVYASTSNPAIPKRQ
jgi:hypothetical protein